MRIECLTHRRIMAARKWSASNDWDPMRKGREEGSKKWLSRRTIWWCYNSRNRQEIQKSYSGESAGNIDFCCERRNKSSLQREWKYWWWWRRHQWFFRRKNVYSRDYTGVQDGIHLKRLEKKNNRRMFKWIVVVSLFLTHLTLCRSHTFGLWSHCRDNTIVSSSGYREDEERTRKANGNKDVQEEVCSGHFTDEDEDEFCDRFLFFFFAPLIVLHLLFKTKRMPDILEQEKNKK